MYSYHNRDDLEKFKKLEAVIETLKGERLKKLGKQDFHYDLKEVFEPVIENQKKYNLNSYKRASTM